MPLDHFDHHLADIDLDRKEALREFWRGFLQAAGLLTTTVVLCVYLLVNAPELDAAVIALFSGR